MCLVAVPSGGNTWYPVQPLPVLSYFKVPRPKGSLHSKMSKVLNIQGQNVKLHSLTMQSPNQTW